MPVTRPPWPSSACCAMGLVGDQTCTSRSDSEVTIVSPCGENATFSIPPAVESVVIRPVRRAIT